MTPSERFDESGRYHDRMALCRIHGGDVDESEIIGDHVCTRCAAEHLLCACDNCGRVLPISASREIREVGETGRIMTYHYCHPCEQEIYSNEK